MLAIKKSKLLKIFCINHQSKLRVEARNQTTETPEGSNEGILMALVRSLEVCEMFKAIFTVAISSGVFTDDQGFEPMSPEF